MRPDRVVDGRKQGVGIHRFFQEISRALLHRAHAGRNGGPAGQIDDRRLDAALLENLMQLRAGHAGHVHVQENTAYPRDRRPRQEVSRRFEGFHREAFGTEQPGQRVAHLRLVVDDRYRRVVSNQGSSRGGFSRRYARCMVSQFGARRVRSAPGIGKRRTQAHSSSSSMRLISSSAEIMVRDKGATGASTATASFSTVCDPNGTMRICCSPA